MDDKKKLLEAVTKHNYENRSGTNFILLTSKADVDRYYDWFEYLSTIDRNASANYKHTLSALQNSPSNEDRVVFWVHKNVLKDLLLWGKFFLKKNELDLELMIHIKSVLGEK